MAYAERRESSKGSLSVLVPRYLHAAHEDADGRYRTAAVQALAEDGGRELAADPAWAAVVRRLLDAEGDGWDPARLLATVAAKRELRSADSVAEVIAWRIDAFLAGSPEPVQAAPATPPGARDASGRPGVSMPEPGHDSTGRAPVPACQPYGNPARARERLAELAATALGAQLAQRARAETAWPALIAALRRAENAGYGPADALTHVATARELRTARSISKVLAWRISRHVAAHPAVMPAATAADPGATAPACSPEPAVTRAEALLPWVPGPRQVTPAAGETAPLTAYIDDAATLITARVTELADTAIRHRPPWMSLLGQQPAAPGRAREWRRHVEVIAAYRDQHDITADDPLQVLGPYAEPGHSGHDAYWHAADSVLAARRISGLDPAGDIGSADGQARRQVAADIYGALPRAERETIATAIAEIPGIMWLGHPDRPDQDAAARPGYAGVLTATLAGHRHASVLNAPVRTDRDDSAEPIEAASTRRRRPPSPRPAHRGTHESDREQHPLQVLRPRHPPCGHHYKGTNGSVQPRKRSVGSGHRRRDSQGWPLVVGGAESRLAAQTTLRQLANLPADPPIAPVFIHDQN